MLLFHAVVAARGLGDMLLSMHGAVAVSSSRCMLLLQKDVVVA